jgi:hypothetical protein
VTSLNVKRCEREGCALPAEAAVVYIAKVGQIQQATLLGDALCKAARPVD